MGIKNTPGGSRTPNTLVRSQMLYPLSYGRVVDGSNIVILYWRKGSNYWKHYCNYINYVFILSVLFNTPKLYTSLHKIEISEEWETGKAYIKL